jgi:hypothetical protein
MSWADLKLLAQDLRNILEAEIDIACVHEAEIIQFDISLKWHIHRICTQLPVPRPSKVHTAETETVSGVSQQAVGDDDGYDSWEESPLPDDLHVDWRAYAEDEKNVALEDPKEEAEQKEYKIVVEGNVEVKDKVKPAGEGGRRGSGLRNVFIAGETIEPGPGEDRGFPYSYDGRYRYWGRGGYGRVYNDNRDLAWRFHYLLETTDFTRRRTKWREY